MDIYLATGNKDKKREIERMLSNHTIFTPQDKGIAFNPKETGETFVDNALIKAKVLFDLVQKPVIADDSGITADILGSVPGVYSARYAGKDFHRGRTDGVKIGQAEQNRLLIEEINEAIKTSGGERGAHYTCALVFYYGQNKFYCVQETLEGEIIDDIKKARGEGGFGYDPIFFIPSLGKTVAQLSEDEKNAISHRGKALRALCKLIKGI